MFVTNVDNYYFNVKHDIDVTKLVDCKIHSSLEEMYNYICEVYGLDIEEVECAELIITNNRCYDNRCCYEEIEGSIEDFINTYEM